jgi:glycosyltransferase involved in cell wall biosynthesis
MRIVQLLPELDEGGVERGVVELNREFVKRGLVSIVISRGGRLAEQIRREGGDHVAFDVCSKNPLTVPLRVVRLKKIVQQLHPDILHARSRVPAWLAYLANRSLRIPFVTTVHGFNSVNPYSRVMTFGDRVICVSNAIRDHIRHHYRVPDEKIVVIPRGVDLDQFDPGKVNRIFMDDFTKEFGLGGRFVVTTVGRISQLKDHETFIRAIGLLRTEVPGTLGLIVGGAREDKRKYLGFLRELVTSLGLENHVVFTGSQSGMAEIYALSRVVVSSSRKPESFGRTAAEALAMDVPVVATAHGGILDIVLEGKTGYLFSPGDPDGLAAGILSCWRTPLIDLRNFVSSRFSLDNMVDATVRVYSYLEHRGMVL